MNTEDRTATFTNVKMMKMMKRARDSAEAKKKAAKVVKDGTKRKDKTGLSSRLILSGFETFPFPCACCRGGDGGDDAVACRKPYKCGWCTQGVASDSFVRFSGAGGVWQAAFCKGCADAHVRWCSVKRLHGVGAYF